MEIGVYFPFRTEYPLLATLGITYAVRPVLTPSRDIFDTGFVSDAVIEKPADPTYHETYGNDEMGEAPDRILPNPAKYAAGVFLTLSNGKFGLNAHYLAAMYHRGMLNYMGFVLSDPFSVPRGVITGLVTRLLWGTDWTVAVWGDHPAWWIRCQLTVYRWMGVRRVFLWRWDKHQTRIQSALPGARQ